MKKREAQRRIKEEEEVQTGKDYTKNEKSSKKLYKRERWKEKGIKIKNHAKVHTTKRKKFTKIKPAAETDGKESRQRVHKVRQMSHAFNFRVT